MTVEVAIKALAVIIQIYLFMRQIIEEDWRYLFPITALTVIILLV